VVTAHVFGIRGGACDSGAEALEILTRHRFDLVVLDVFMEPVGGLKVLQSIKKLWPRTLVEIMTGLSTIDLAVEAMKMGADEFVTKPFRIKEFTAQVAHFIDQRKPRSHPLARRLDEFVREHSGQPDLSLRVLTGRFQVSERRVSTVPGRAQDHLSFALAPPSTGASQGASQFDAAAGQRGGRDVRVYPSETAQRGVHEGRACDAAVVPSAIRIGLTFGTSPHECRMPCPLPKNQVTSTA
jgi:CheY-like chemotaxis protein